MKNKNLFIIGLLIAAIIAIGGLAYFQESGNIYQGALIRSTTTSYTTQTLTLESLNNDIKALKEEIATLKKFKNDFDQSYLKNNEATCAALFSSGALHPYINEYNCINKLLSPLDN